MDSATEATTGSATNPSWPIRMLIKEAPVTVGTVVYDGECGLCRWVVARLRRRCATVEVVAFQQAAALGIAVDSDRAPKEMLWIAPDGTVAGGAEAFTAWFKAMGGRTAWAGRALGLPVVRVAARMAYRWIAAHRRAVPGPWEKSCSIDDRHM
jgi:predicted DCC family thiol-disulfide oxidoreductase YuxK